MNLPEMQHQIGAYGYYAVLVGAIVEGETILMLAAMAAASGLLDLRLVILCSTVSATTGDNLYFWLGRLQGKVLLRWFPALTPRLERFNALLTRWHTPLIVLLRFLYGLRTVGPMAVGMSNMSALGFLLIDAFSALLWSCTFSALGYLLGQQLLPLLSQPGALRAVLRPLAPVAAGLLVIALTVWWVRRRRAADKS